VSNVNNRKSASQEVLSPGFEYKWYSPEQTKKIILKNNFEKQAKIYL
jgi:hypothetical protein